MIEARWAIHIANDLRRAGHALDGVLKEVGLKRADLTDPENRITYAAYVGLIERAAMLLADPAYGLKLGASHDVRDNGLIGFLALNSPTLNDALANVERYVAVTNEGIDAVFEREGQGSALRFRETDAALRGLRHNSEQVAATVVTGARGAYTQEGEACRCVSSSCTGGPTQISTTNASSAARSGSMPSGTASSMPRKPCACPALVGADNKLLRVLEVACRKIIGRPPRRQDLVHSVREYVVQRLAKGPVPFDDVASHSNMSSKTLERRLGERGARYRELVDDVRCDLFTHLPDRHRPAPAADHLPAGIFGACTLGAGFQAMDRLHAHTVPRQAAVTGRAKKF